MISVGIRTTAVLDLSVSNLSLCTQLAFVDELSESYAIAGLFSRFIFVRFETQGVRDATLVRDWIAGVRDLALGAAVRHGLATRTLLQRQLIAAARAALLLLRLRRWLICFDHSI